MLPLGSSVVPNRLLPWELDVVELPSSGHISLVGEIDMDSSVSFDVDGSKVKLIHCVVVLGDEVSQQHNSWPHEHGIDEEVLAVTIVEPSDQLSLSLVKDGHWPLSGFRH